MARRAQRMRAARAGPEARAQFPVASFPGRFFAGEGKKRRGHHCSRMRIFAVKYSVSRTAKYTMHVSK